MIPYGRQIISEQDVDAVVDVLRSDFLTQGPRVKEFEDAFCNQLGVRAAVAMNSATSALHAACLALGLGRGDRLWTSPNTFVASANCAMYCGAQVDFVDIDLSTYNLCMDKLEEKLIKAATSKTLPKIVVPVHFGGNPCDMRRLKKLSEQFGFAIIEDASHAVGAKYNGDPVGSCRFSDITVFSFHPVKIITSGEGGLALTNDQDLAEKMSQIRSHGITRDPDQLTQHQEQPWYYEQQSLGFNYRMNDIEAALGLSQLEKLQSFIRRRNELADCYTAALTGSSVNIQTVRDVDCSSWHLYVVTLPDCDRTRRDKIFKAMREAGIGVNLHYIPVHLQPFYAALGFKLGDFPAAEYYFDHCLTLPLHPGLTKTNVDFIAGQLLEQLS